MACNVVLIVGILMSFVMNLGHSSSVQVKWSGTPPPPSVVCTYCSTCQDPCNPPVVSPPPPPPPVPQKPPQIGCPPPPAPYHYVFPPPAGVGYNPYYPYNYPYDFNLSRPPLVPRRFDILCLAGFLVYFFL